MKKYDLTVIIRQISPPDHWEHTVIKSFDFPVSATYGKLRSKADLNDRECGNTLLFMILL